MDKSQELIFLFVIFFALIPLSRSLSALMPLSSRSPFVTVTEDEAVQLEFPYPCDSNRVTIQSANRLPFYSSAEPESLNLPFYQLNRFSVTDGNCSVQVVINPVKRSDEATYICQTYVDGVIQGRFTRIRLNVHHPPGDVACTFNFNDDAVGDWVPLQCTAPVGSLAGGIYCYQDYTRLAPQSNIVQLGETLKQTFWARLQISIFCCSAILDRPKDRCDCKGFVWDPIGNISHTKTIIDPCPGTTPGLVATLSKYPEREVEDNSQLHQLINSPKPTDTNKDKSTANNTTMLWVHWSNGAAIVCMIIMLVIILIVLYLTKKIYKKCKKYEVTYHTETMVENETPFTSSQKKEIVLNVLSSNKHSMARPNSL
ncbi:uncharacterized protein LOC115927851 [Strongylocentrotus purpuratus]|uniref:Immunoglobulin domain-containing protein n=1 Tax=Strongylocentrotus purpuratus TaxID=7668 RepID=A0A7M7PDV4_STRPU|nr:uncharacterized protein LOC115927851 [Strongylocentrotus purpuratus]